MQAHRQQHGERIVGLEALAGILGVDLATASRRHRFGANVIPAAWDRGGGQIVVAAVHLERWLRGERAL